MKIELQNGIVTVASETKDEALQLVGMFMIGDEIATTKPTKRKYVTTKKCDVCGKECRGLKGLATHKSWLHHTKRSNLLE